MLKIIPQVLTPDLIKVMMEMGHGDHIVLADANFPAYTNAKMLIRLAGVEIPFLLESILPYFPLDGFAKHPILLMKNERFEPVPTIWNTYYELIKRYDEENAFHEFSWLERHEFYDFSKSAAVIVQTATTARYANIILKKGVI